MSRPTRQQIIDALILGGIDGDQAASDLIDYLAQLGLVIDSAYSVAALRETARIARDNIKTLMLAYPDNYPTHAFQATHDRLARALED